MARKRADFKDNSSIASGMNSGDSNNLNSNCIRIDPRTGEKFSFNVDIVWATAWQHLQQYTFIHPRSLNTFHPMGGVLVFCTVHYVIVDPPERKSSARCPILLDDDNFLGPWNRSLLNLLKLPPTAEVGRMRDDCWTTTTFWVPVCIS